MKKVTTFETSDWVLSFMEGLSCPRSVTVAILYRYGQVADIQLLDCQPVHYNSADSYRRAAAATKLLSKITSFDTDLDPEAYACATWLDTEKQCFRSNRRINEILDFGTEYGVPVPDAVDFFDRVKGNVEMLIGSRPPHIVRGCFGPGATLSDKSVRTTVPHKMSTTPTLTASAWVHVPDWMSSKWAAACAARGDSELLEVGGNTYFQVPKNAKTNRM